MKKKSCAFTLEQTTCCLPAALAKAKRRHAGANVVFVNLAAINAALLPRLNGKQDVVLLQVALKQRDANVAVGVLTAGKAFALATVRAAAVVLNKAAFFAVATGRWLDNSVASLVARLVLAGKLWSALTRARVCGAQVDRAVFLGLAEVNLDNTALVELRARDRVRFSDPLLRIAFRVALVAADGAEGKLHAVIDAGSLALHHNDLVNQGAGLDLVRRTSGRIKERQSDVLALASQQVARNAQARLGDRRAEAVAARNQLTNLQRSVAVVRQDVAQLVGQFPAIVWQFSEARRHFKVLNKVVPFRV